MQSLSTARRHGQAAEIHIQRWWDLMATLAGLGFTPWDMLHLHEEPRRTSPADIDTLIDALILLSLPLTPRCEFGTPSSPGDAGRCRVVA